MGRWSSGSIIIFLSVSFLIAYCERLNTTLINRKKKNPSDESSFDLQSYPHKILTGRRDKMYTMRQTNGLAGFTKRSESEYDCFGTGHSSTTISAGLGINLVLFHSFCRVRLISCNT